MEQIKVKFWGYPGHLCVASRCKFHLTSTTESYLISTVGDYRPTEESEMEPIGAGEKSFFETYVFKFSGRMKQCGCCPEIDDLSEIYGERYATAIEATEGHTKCIEKYLKEASCKLS